MGLLCRNAFRGTLGILQEISYYYADLLRSNSVLCVCQRKLGHKMPDVVPPGVFVLFHCDPNPNICHCVCGDLSSMGLLVALRTDIF